MCSTESRCGRESLKSCVCSLDPVNKIVNCSNAGLDIVPRDIPNDTTHLYLDANNITILTSKSFLPGLPKLVFLSMKSNGMKKLMENSLTGLPSLRILNLFNNNLEAADSFPQSVFGPVGQSLHILDIRRNLMNLDIGLLHYPQAIEKLASVVEIYLDYLSRPLHRFFATLKQLQKLCFSGGRPNSLKETYLQNTTFNSLSSLNITEINLSGLNITNAWEDIFANLKRLKVLDVSHNSLLGHVKNIVLSLQNTLIEGLHLNNTGIGLSYSTKKVLISLCSLNRTLKRLFLNGNDLTSFSFCTKKRCIPVKKCFPKLELLSLAENNLQITDDVLSVLGLKNLIGYNISYQNSQTASSSGMGSQNVKGIVSRGPGVCLTGTTCTFYFPKHMIWYDCSHNAISFQDFPATVLLKNSTLKEFIATDNGILNVKKPLYCADGIQVHFEKLNLNGNSLHCCAAHVFHPPNKSCNWNSVKFVYLRNNQLGSVTKNASENDCNLTFSNALAFLEPFVNLRELDLARNGLRSEVNMTVLETFRELQLLDLSNNNLETFFLTLSKLVNLKKLDLSSNRIQCLSKNFFHEVPKEKDITIDLSNNLLECKCECVHFFEWMVKMVPTQVHVIGNEMYSCGSEKGTDLKEAKVKLKAVCYSIKWLKVFLVLELCLSLTIVAIALTCRERHNIWYMYLKMRMNRNKLKMLFHEDKYTYSAFVSCDVRDASSFIKGRFLPELETQETELKFCIAQRNFLVGATIMDNILRAIHRSRKTIFIISKYFLQSKWCKEELTIAHQV